VKLITHPTYAALPKSKCGLTATPHMFMAVLKHKENFDPLKAKQREREREREEKVSAVRGTTLNNGEIGNFGHNKGSQEMPVSPSGKCSTAPGLSMYL
jgi:hypothetical protein